MEFTIPERFSIFGLDYTVRLDAVLAHKRNNIGEASYRLQEIILQPSTDSQPRSADSIKQTFWHELVHVALHLIGRDDLSNDESLTDTLAHAIYQALKTASGAVDVGNRISAAGGEI